MKGAIGAYLAAVDDYLQTNEVKGSLSILLTTDEEGPAVDGLRYVVEQFKARGEQIDACLVGEPTNIDKVGDTVKVGRRGSLNATLTVAGKAGHVGYPHLAKNPILPLLSYLQGLLSTPLDTGMANFDPSHLEVTSIDVANPTTNVIPSEASAKFNIRFNPTHSQESLTRYLQDKAEAAGLNQGGFTYSLQARSSGGAFLCEDKDLQGLVCEAVFKATGLKPTLSTGGGTSDARFLKDICPVIEFGLVNATAHQTDEHIAVAEIHCLKATYQEIIKVVFSGHLGQELGIRK
jgi:succinyl-diaminopimelate desuccinylase